MLYCCPIPKTSLPQTVEEYLRPISLTSQVSKVMEGFIKKKLLSPIEYKLDTKQFGLPSKSTTHALVLLHHSILSAFEIGNCSVRLRFVDFKMRFDLVGHNVTLRELESLDVHPVIVRWIKAFLNNREQCVRIKNSSSTWKKTNGSLPQRTRLGLLLFAVLVNSFLKDGPGRAKFVDDTTAIEEIPRCSPSFLPIVVNQISDFTNERGMVLNPKKCKEMIITFLKCKHSENDIFIGDDFDERVISFKLLGVWLTNNLSWELHVDKLLRKANSRIYKYALHLSTEEGWPESLGYSSYLLFINKSQIEYALPVWSVLPNMLYDLIEAEQKRALKIAYPYLSYEEASLRGMQFKSLISKKRYVLSETT